MKLTAYVTRYDRDDVHDGEVYADVETHELHAGPTEMVDDVQRLADAGWFETLAWSSSPAQREGDWITLAGHDCGSYLRGDREYVDVSLHGSLAQLQRFAAHWAR